MLVELFVPFQESEFLPAARRRSVYVFFIVVFLVLDMSANTSSSSSSASGSVLVTATVSLPRSGGDGSSSSSSSSESPSVTTFEIRRDVSAIAAGEAVDATPYSFEFTGKHDDGSLPAAGSGYYAHLVDSLLEAKIAIDSVLKLEAAKEKISNPVGAPPKVCGIQVELSSLAS